MKRFDHKLDFKNGLLKGYDMMQKPRCLLCFDRGLVIGMDGRVTNCIECEVGKSLEHRYKPNVQTVPIKTSEDIEDEAKEAEKEAFEKETERLLNEVKTETEVKLADIQIKKKGRPAKVK